MNFFSDNSGGHPPLMNYRPDIDGLRAIAILSVVLFHAFPQGLRGGFVGVDVFFVISGFLITGIIDREIREQRFTLLRFYARRARRIFPALIVVLVSVMVAGAILLLPGEYRQLGLHVAGGVGFVENIILYRESGYFDTASEVKPLLHLWSLAVEEQFYFLFPLLFLMLRGAANRRFGLLTMLAIASFLTGLLSLRSDPAGAFFLAHNRVWELLVGALMASCPRPLLKMSGSWKQWLSGTGFFLLFISLILIRREEGFPGYLAVFPVFGAALMIAAGPDAWLNRRVLSFRPLVALGLISYPLYLWHWPLLAFARIWFPDLSAPARLGLILAGLILAFVTAIGVEKPIRFGSFRKTTIKWLWFVMLLCGLLGSLIYIERGLPDRFADSRQRGAGIDALSDASDSECRGPKDKSATCRMKDAGNPSVGLVGDSHANHLQAGLRDAHVLFKFRSRHSCPPFLGAGFGDQGSECPVGYLDSALVEMMDDPHIKSVILAGRYYVYWSGRAPIASGRYKGSSIPIPLIGAYPPGTSSDVFRAAAEQTARRLVEKGKKVIFVLDVPEMGFDPLQCLRGLPHRPISMAHCGTSRERYEADRRECREFLEGLARRIKGVVVIDPASLLCSDVFCSAMNDKSLLYMDDDHLSEYGSRVLAPLWISALKDSLAR